MAITTRHQLLAWDLVEALGDEAHKGIYFRLAKIYDEIFLRKALSDVKDAFNRGRIKKEDRGRYFMGILKKEADKLSVNKKNNGKSIKNNARRRSGVKKKSRTGRKSKKSGN